MGFPAIKYHSKKPQLSFVRGGLFPSAKKSTKPYRFEFNGQEKDDETYGTGNTYDFGARIYDSRLGRWLSLDPLQTNYPNLSPYCFVGNGPTIAIDPDGKKIIIVGSESYRIQVLVTLALLGMQSSTGRDLILKAMNSEATLVIAENTALSIGINSETSEIDPNTGVQKGEALLTWNLGSAAEILDAANGLGDKALETKAEITFAHELQHFIDFANGKKYPKVVNPDNPGQYVEYGDDPTYTVYYYSEIPGSEINAVETENKVRAEMGLPLRTHYAGINVFNKEISKTAKKIFDKDDNVTVTVYTPVPKAKPVDFEKLKKDNVTLGTEAYGATIDLLNEPCRHFGFGESKVDCTGKASRAMHVRPAKSASNKAVPVKKK